MLEIQNLRTGYDGKEILHGIDLSVPDSSVTIIVGPNGCGKSTLLKTIAGIHPAVTGDIRLDGVDLDKLSSQMRAQQVAYLAQSRPISDITVERMVLHGRFPYLSYPRRYRREDMEIAQQAMAAVGIQRLARRYLSTLSGGQRQNVYIAMTLAQDTKLVLMDEPTTFLDISNQMQMMAQARFLTDQGKSVILVLHDLSAALRCADHLVVMKDGAVLDQGSSDWVFENGCLEEAFGVRVERFQTADGWQYYYRERR